MTPQIRRIGEEDLPAFIEAMSAGFLARPDVEKVAAEVKPLWELKRTSAAFDGDRIVGTFRTWATELTVPGGAQLPGAAVTNVTVLPTHRRRGVLRGMVAAEHGAIRERGEAVGLLWASEWPIYGRFGYGPACLDSTWTLDTRATTFHRDPAGVVELAKPSEATRDLVMAVYETLRLRQPGEIRRRDWGWDFDLGLRENAWDSRWKGFLALHRDDSGAVDGYARYRADDKWENRQPHNTLTVDELHALNDEAYMALWRFLAEVDWVATVKAERRSPSERLRWYLTNARAAVLSEVGESMWVRLFDVPRARSRRGRTSAKEASSSRSSMAKRSAAARASSSMLTRPVPGPARRRSPRT